jgi:PKD repeat protein
MKVAAVIIIILLSMNVLDTQAATQPSPLVDALPGCGAGSYTWNYSVSQYDSYSPDSSATYVAGVGWQRVGSGNATIYQPIDFSALTNYSLTVSVSGNMSLNVGVNGTTRRQDNTLTDVHVLYGPYSYGGAAATNSNLVAFFQQASGTTSTLEIFTASGTRLCANPPISFFIITPNSGNVDDTFDFTDASDDNGSTITSWAWDFGDAATSTDQNPSHQYALPGDYEVELCVTNISGEDCSTQMLTVVNPNGYPGGTLYEPVTDYGEQGILEAGENLVDPWVEETNNMVYFDTPTADDNVYAISTGDVISITALTDCLDANAVEITFGGIGDLCELFFSAGGNNYYYEILKSGVYIVKVQFTEDSYIYYMVSDAPMYVRAGLTVRAGCIIGKTIDYSVPGSDIVQTILPGAGGTLLDNNANGVGAVWLSDAANSDNVPLFAQLLLPVDPLNACNADPSAADCLGDPNFGSQYDWESYGAVQWLGNTITLGRGGLISYPLRLSSTLQYSVTVPANIVTGTTATISVSLGGTSESFTLNQHFTEIVIDAHTPVPDSTGGSIYTLTIQNNGTNPVELLSNCVTDGTANTTPNTCYFRNFDFDDGFSGWTTTGSVLEGETGSPWFFYPGTAGQISQNMALYPDGATTHTYLLEVETLLLRAASYSSDSTSTVSLEYQWAGGSWTGLSAPSSSTSGYPFNSFITQAPYTAYRRIGNVIVFYAQIPVATYTSGTFNLRVSITTANSGTFYLEVKKVCINDPFSNWGDDGSGTPGGANGGGIQFPTNCSRIDPPTEDTEIGPWIFYHWSNLDRFFQCDLMIMLNRMFNLGYDAYEFALWQMLYGQELSIRYSDWANRSLLPWLGGYFANMANGRTTTVIESGGSCSDLWCVLTALIEQVIAPIVDAITGLVNLLLQAGSLLLTALTMLLSLIFSLLNSIMGLFSGFISLLTGFTNAINNATPVPLPLLPTCQLDPQQNGFCLILWAFENTIFADEGILILWLILGFYALRLLMWMVHAYANNISEAGTSL